MSARVLALAAGVALLGTGAAVAANAANPTALVLRKADLPAGSTYVMEPEDQSGIDSTLHAGGVDPEAASYLGQQYTKAKGFLQVTGVVFATMSRAQAIKTFGLVAKHQDARQRQLGGPPLKAVSVPRYGDQQRARFDPPGGEGISSYELIVRRNTVVWILWVKRERRPTLPTAELAAEFKAYAAKQKLRVGRG